MEIDLHFNRSSSSHLNTYKVRIFGTIVFKTLSYIYLCAVFLADHSKYVNI